MRRVVTFHYTLRDPAGQVVDTSAGGEPIAFLEGAGEIIPGLDTRLRAAATGDKLRVLVPAAEAYGERDPAQVQRVQRALLPVAGTLEVGAQFQAGEDRAAPVVTVVAIDGDRMRAGLGVNNRPPDRPEAAIGPSYTRRSWTLAW